MVQSKVCKIRGKSPQKGASNSKRATKIQDLEQTGMVDAASSATGKEVSRQRRWQLKQAALGKCITCGKPAVAGVLCLEHRRKQTVQRRKLKGFKAWKPGKVGRPRKY